MSQKDICGTIYNSPDGNPATNGTQINILTNNGLVPGQMIGGNATPFKS